MSGTLTAEYTAIHQYMDSYVNVMTLQPQSRMSCCNVIPLHQLAAILLDFLEL